MRQRPPTTDSNCVGWDAQVDIEDRDVVGRDEFARWRGEGCGTQMGSVGWAGGDGSRRRGVIG